MLEECARDRSFQNCREISDLSFAIKELAGWLKRQKGIPVSLTILSSQTLVSPLQSDLASWQVEELLKERLRSLNVQDVPPSTIFLRGKRAVSVSSLPAFPEHPSLSHMDPLKKIKREGGSTSFKLMSVAQWQLRALPGTGESTGQQGWFP